MVEPVVFKSIEELEKCYFPEYCKEHPITMRLTEEEAALILGSRGLWSPSITKVRKQTLSFLITRRAVAAALELRFCNG